MRPQRALPVMGCGTLGVLALAVSACGSSSNKTDGGVNDDAGAEHLADTSTPSDVKDTAIELAGDTATDRGAEVDVKPDTGPSDQRDTGGSICSGTPPNANRAGEIADFDDSSGVAFGVVGQDPVGGGTYVKTSSLVEEFSELRWHLSGTVYGHQDLFGLYWICKVAASGGCTLDVSQYAGIQFTIKGNVGPDHTLGFTLGRAEDDTPSENANCGTCTVPADASSSEAACHGPRTVITEADPSVAQTVTFYWASFYNGSPKITADPHQLTGVLWFFPDPHPTDGGIIDGGSNVDGGAALDAGPDAPPAGAPSYQVDFTIDDIKFIPFP